MEDGSKERLDLKVIRDFKGLMVSIDGIYQAIKG